MVEINPHIQQNQFYDVYKKGTGIVTKMSHVTIGQILETKLKSSESLIILEINNLDYFQILSVILQSINKTSKRATQFKNSAIVSRVKLD